MGRLGSYLRELRESRGMSLEEISKATRIGRGHLEALESDDAGALPAPVFVKGFIRAYCREVQGDEAEALALYLEPQRPPAPPRAATPRPAQAPTRRGTVVLSAALMLVLITGLIALNLPAWRTPTGAPPVPPAPVAPAPQPQAETAPAATTDGAPAPQEPGAAGPATAAAPADAAPAEERPPAPPALALPPAPAGHRLQIKATERTWIRVQPDDGSPQQATLEPGALREWTAQQRFLLTVGNAGGIEVTLDGQRLPSLGDRGAVVRDLLLPGATPGTGS